MNERRESDVAWENEVVYRGYYIWLTEVRNTDKPWVFSVGRISGGAATPLPGQIVGPGQFDTSDEAEEAAKRYIDQDILQKRG